MDLVFYNGAHSAIFGGEVAVDEDNGEATMVYTGGKHSWKDWHLIPTQKPVIPPPSIKMKQVDIPGVHGSLNLSTVLTGYPVYNNRQGSLSYILAPGYEEWEGLKTEIMEYLHGKTMRLYLDDDPGYFYTGMLWVNELKSDARINSIAINYDLHPFKYDILDSGERWLWDPFNFETGVIRDWGQVEFGGQYEMTIEGALEAFTPVIIPSVSMQLTHYYKRANGEARSATYTLSPGVNFTGCTIRPGDNRLVFTTSSNNATVSVRYRGGHL